MEKLCKEYIELLSSEEDASTKFWDLEKRIRKDKKDSGVMVEEMSRSNMDIHIMNLLVEKAIALEDLAEFSEEFQERMKLFIESRI